MKSRHFFLLGCAVLLLLTSCFKEEQPQLEPEPIKIADTILTEAKLIGKWEIVYVTIYTYRGDTLDSWDEWIKDDGYYPFGRRRVDWKPEFVSYITFTNDKQFSHVKPSGELNSYMLDELVTPQGNWKLENTTKLTLPSITYYQAIADSAWTCSYKDSVLVLNLALESPLRPYNDAVFIKMEKQ